MGTATIAIPEETVLSLKQIATDTGKSAEALADQAIQQFVRDVAERKIQQEEIHYRTQHAQLLLQYAGMYIAMHRGEVVDVDTDELALFLRVRKTYPSMGILIKQVQQDPEEVWTMRSPRLEYR